MLVMDRNEEPKAVFQCSECMKIWSNRKRFVQHVKSCKGKQSTKSYACAYCLESFRTRSGRQYHVNKRHSLVRKECQYCQKTFASEILLASHMKTHDLQQHVFECFFCSRTFITQKIRSVHCRKEHPEDQKLRDTIGKLKKIYKCSHCGKSFASKWYRKKHEEYCGAMKDVDLMATPTLNCDNDIQMQDFESGSAAIDLVVMTASSNNSDTETQTSTPALNNGETPSLAKYSRDGKEFTKLGTPDMQTPRRTLANLGFGQRIVKKYQRKVGTLQQTIRRLRQQIKTMEEMIAHLENEGHINSTLAELLSTYGPSRLFTKIYDL